MGRESADPAGRPKLLQLLQGHKDVTKIGKHGAKHTSHTLYWLNPQQCLISPGFTNATSSYMKCTSERLSKLCKKNQKKIIFKIPPSC